LAHVRSREPAPAVLTVLAVVLLGWIDEGIQARVPERVCDLRDVGSNAAAGLMAVAARLALDRARRSDIVSRWLEGSARERSEDR
jgi:hypothetical protein